MIYELLRSDGSIVVNKNLARNIGLEEAIVYSEILSRYFYFKNRGEMEGEWFYYKVEKMVEQTTINIKKQRKCITKLVELGLIDSKVRGVPAKRYFKVNEDEAVLVNILNGKFVASKAKTTEQYRPKRPNSIGQNDRAYFNNTDNNTKDNVTAPLVQLDDSIEKILLTWNKSVHTSNHSLTKQTKTLKRIVEHISLLKKGALFQTFPLLNKQVLKRMGVPFDAVNKSFSDEEIISTIESFLLQFEDGYWPFDKKAKSKLPKSFLTFLINTYNPKCPSTFLKVFYNPPKRIDLPVLDAVQESGKKIIQKFLDESIYNYVSIGGGDDLEFTVIDLHKEFLEIVADAGEYYSCGGLDLNPQEVKACKRDNYFGAVIGYSEKDFTKFCKSYVEYLKKDFEAICDFLEGKRMLGDKVATHKLMVKNLSPYSKYKNKWKGFGAYLKSEYKIGMYLSKQERVCLEQRAKEVCKRVKVAS